MAVSKGVDCIFIKVHFIITVIITIVVVAGITVIIIRWKMIGKWQYLVLVFLLLVVIIIFSVIFLL